MPNRLIEVSCVVTNSHGAFPLRLAMYGTEVCGLHRPHLTWLSEQRRTVGRASASATYVLNPSILNARCTGGGRFSNEALAHARRVPYGDLRFP